MMRQREKPNEFQGNIAKRHSWSNLKNYALKRYSFVLILSSLIIFLPLLYAYDREKAKKLYIEQCSKCHRKDGRGIKGVYPPLKNSDYVQKGDKIELLRGMLFGRSGKIVVNGEVYYGVMLTEVDQNLKDDEIAMILEFVYREFNGMEVSVSAQDVVKARKLGKLPPHK